MENEVGYYYPIPCKGMYQLQCGCGKSYIGQTEKVYIAELKKLKASSAKYQEHERGCDGG